MTPPHPTEFPSLALLTPDEMGRVDALAAAAGATQLMEHAGRAVARAVMRHIKPCPTLVLCGPGNNGGDGYVTARRLREAGWPTRLAALAPPQPGTDAATAATRWPGPIHPFSPTETARASMVIDAVFGAGLSRDVDGLAADCLRAASRLVAIDIPSGIDGATGAIRGFAPQAELTITFVRRKPGHLLFPGRALCGRTELADILMPQACLAAITPTLFANHPSLWSLPTVIWSDHKYTRGDLTIIGGHMPGAARLAAAAARRAGAGIVTVAATGWVPLDAGLILSDAPLPTLLADPRRQTWLIGPGLGIEAARATLPHLLTGTHRVVVDADALTACATTPDRLRGAAILTPHVGEFARVFGPPGHDRLAAVRAAAAQTGAVVVLKGADTIIAAPNGHCVINHNAPPDLATAGTGDVLAGIIAALLAHPNGMTPFDAACAGVWLHGHAATLAGTGLIAEDLPPHLPAATAAARDLHHATNRSGALYR